EIEAPATYWSSRLVLDGKEHKRLPEFSGAWNGPRAVLPKTDFRTTLALSEYGVKPTALALGSHKITLKIAEDESSELTINIRPVVRPDETKADAPLQAPLPDEAAEKSRVAFRQG